MRDTDHDWQQYGEFEPYYGVLTHERFLRANLTPEVREEFWNSGRHDVQMIWGELTRLFGEKRPSRALDFGCGVGRLVHGMADLAGEVVGIDIAPAMIAEAQQQAPTNATFTSDMPQGPFDWINSYIVFQHIPPQRGYGLFEDLLDRAATSCLLSLHFTLFKDPRGLCDHGLSAIRYGTWDGETICALLPAITGRVMMMYDYDLNRLFATLIAHGFARVHLAHTDHGGAHGAMIYAAR